MFIHIEIYTLTHERRNNMKRTLALFTVLLAFAIFAMPTYAGKPMDHLIRMLCL